MAFKGNTTEGITPSGTTVTAGNSGGTSGDAWQSTSSAGATLASDNAHAAHGSLSVKIATTTSATSFTTWTLTATGTWFFRVYFWVDSITAATNPSIMRFRGTTDTVQCIRVTFDSSGHIQIRNTANTVVATSTATFTLSQWNRLEGFCTPGNGAATGSAETKLFVGDQATPVANGTTTITGQNFGSVTNIDAISFGQVVAFASLPAEWMDDFAASTVAYIGPSVQTNSPASIPSAESFGAVTETPGRVTLSPASIASAQAFGTVVESPGPVTRSPASIASAEAFGTPVESPGRVTLNPTSIASAESFGTPASHPQMFTFSPASIGTQELFGTPTQTPGPATLHPAPIASDEAFGQVFSFQASVVTLSPASIESKEKFGQVISARISPAHGACCDGAEFNTPCCLVSVPEGVD